jgi:opine dehydrogenase
MTKRNVAVIGAGNGGQAISGALALSGHEVTLYSRSRDKIEAIKRLGGIILTEALTGHATLHGVTDDLGLAVRDAEVIMVTTSADAHREVTLSLAPHLRAGQIIVLNPGRTGGALEVRKVLVDAGVKTPVYVAEAQSLVFACRAVTVGSVRIIGIKIRVPIAALPASDNEYVLSLVRDLFTCFQSADNVLVTSLENIGAVFHPAVVLLNAAAIERGEMFRFYEDMMPITASFIDQVDRERLAVGRAYGLKLRTAEDWVTYAYPGVKGTNLCEKMRNNPAYSQILAPTTISSRLLLEDIPTGVVPFVALGELAGVQVPLLRSLVVLGQVLVAKNFWITGRTLKNMGIADMSVKSILRRIM